MVHLLLVVVAVIVAAVLVATAPIVAISVLVWLAFLTVGYVIGQPKGRGAAGIVLGAVLGPIGWLIAALLAPSAEIRAERDAAANPPA